MLCLGSKWNDDGYSSGDYDDDNGDYEDDDKGNHHFQANLSEDLMRLLGLAVPSCQYKDTVLYLTRSVTAGRKIA